MRQDVVDSYFAPEDTPCARDFAVTFYNLKGTNVALIDRQSGFFYNKEPQNNSQRLGKIN